MAEAAAAGTSGVVTSELALLDVQVKPKAQSDDRNSLPAALLRQAFSGEL